MGYTCALWEHIMRTAVWPVVHLDADTTRTMRQVDVAVQAGADGVFLIQMHGHDDLIDPQVALIRTKHPALPLGVNFLSLGARAGVERSLGLGCQASWSDRSCVRGDGCDPEAAEIAAVLRDHPGHMFFASVAFKYQAVEPNPHQAAQHARDLGFVPTTSGVATGSAPDVGKLQAMHHTAADPLLAVASGVTPENVRAMAPFVSHVLVATGVSDGEDLFDFERLARLVGLAHQH